MFNEVKKNFGFGCMRLPMAGEQVDFKEFCLMIDDLEGSEFDMLGLKELQKMLKGDKND